MIQPPELESPEDLAVWEAITAAAGGDIDTLGHLLARFPHLANGSYFYTPIIHFAVREGHAALVDLLLAAGADPERNGYYGVSLSEMALERGHDAIALLNAQCPMPNAQCSMPTGAFLSQFEHRALGIDEARCYGNANAMMSPPFATATYCALSKT